MFRALYSFGIRAFGLGLWAASFFSEKAKKRSKGGRLSYKNLHKKLGADSILWFHAASLGEAEMALPIIQNLKQEFPANKTLLTFFSPSGIDHFKPNPAVDFVDYLPLDTPQNARKFLDAGNFQLAFFIKYEIWPNFFTETLRRKIPLVLAPAVFRDTHFYFKKPARHFFLPLLKKLDGILVQDQYSLQLLQKEGFKNVERVGDSRFDRVAQNRKAEFSDAVLETFTDKQTVLIGGSTWPPGEGILQKIAIEFSSLKIIIAPHDVSEKHLQGIERQLAGKTFRHSAPPADFIERQICLIDGVGKLSKMYRYGDFAYIGGGFGAGLHNALEAVAYGLPIFFGPRHQHFIETKEMMRLGFAHAVSNSADAKTLVKEWIENSDILENQSRAALQFIENQSGATQRIVHFCRALLHR